MIRKPVDVGDPDRLYMVTGGRSEADDSFDLVTLVVSECEPTPGMQSEHVRILELCRHPTAVVEISAELALPVTVVRILLGDLHDMGKVSARHPRAAASVAGLPETALLQEVLHGLRNL
ncbi:DUF742 domain-containing protein [Streptomyces longwoodensis]|uniref:DUF742 domain-containing protein n=1 Tax=Streptomyces longwoodensis TaxID=68231 RepID=UPI00225BB0EB|nr:DUF742 domain-containing protein [Streptomyces longwoodensis]MCX4996506.1 DUF742 domain-containing protein [Streptomyces longwoodensis]WRY91194.1 DUF742 domain-containing protein [Streptomyces longwoodensis]WTI44513.1 DUF742 domain-containing protein [Streptomyces longwoodensis]WUC57309.1 DUF742 domain-containing protein [Streptomyces longwoodensis]WUC70809.1 DUF742 domain-containing protein [Streptomyces longwoodensis]